MLALVAAASLLTIIIGSCVGILENAAAYTSVITISTTRNAQSHSPFPYRRLRPSTGRSIAWTPQPGYRHPSHCLTDIPSKCRPRRTKVAIRSAAVGLSLSIWAQSSGILATVSFEIIHQQQKRQLEQAACKVGLSASSGGSLLNRQFPPRLDLRA